MKFRILAALREDINSGHVWIRMENQKLPVRSVVRIKHLGNKRTAYCEAIDIGKNFLDHYNQHGRVSIKENENSIVINEWYRVKLGNLETQSEEDLDMEIADGWWGRLWACLLHPQVIVRLATWLGIISVILGLLSIVPVIDIFKFLISGARWILKLLKVA